MRPPRAAAVSLGLEIETACCEEGLGIARAAGCFGCDAPTFVADSVEPIAGHFASMALWSASVHPDVVTAARRSVIDQPLTLPDEAEEDAGSPALMS